VRRDELLRVTKLEAQAWLAVYALVMHPETQKRYAFDSFRKSTLLRARRFVNDVLLDQIPMLAELQRFMDQLALVDAPQPTALAERQAFVLQQVPAQRERVLRDVKIDDVVQKLLASDAWTKGGQDDAKDLACLVDVYTPPDLSGDYGGENDDDDDVKEEEEEDVVKEEEEEKVEPPLVEELSAEEVASMRAREEATRRARALEQRKLDTTIETVELLGDALDPIVFERVPFAVTTLKGPDGRSYCRTKWVDPSGGLASPYLVVHVTYASGRREVLEDDLSCQGGGTLLEDMPPAQNALWRQLGDAENDLALQLFLKRRKKNPEAKSYLINSFTVPVLYVSTPVLDFSTSSEEQGKVDDPTTTLAPSSE